MEFNSIRYDILEALLMKYPNEGRLHYLLALEEAAVGDNKLAKDRLGEAAKLSDESMKSEICDLMCHLYSGKSFIPIQPTDRGKDIFFELERFSLNEDIEGIEKCSSDGTYSADQLSYINEIADELDEEIEEPEIEIDMPSDEIFPYGLRLVRCNEFAE